MYKVCLVNLNARYGIVDTGVSGGVCLSASRKDDVHSLGKIKSSRDGDQVGLWS